MQQRDLFSANDQMITFSRAVPFSNPVTVYTNKEMVGYLGVPKQKIIKLAFLDWQGKNVLHFDVASATQPLL